MIILSLGSGKASKQAVRVLEQQTNTLHTMHRACLCDHLLPPPRGPNPSKVIQQLLALRVDQQLHIFNSLKAHLTEKGLLPALEEAAA